MLTVYRFDVVVDISRVEVKDHASFIERLKHSDCGDAKASFDRTSWVNLHFARESTTQAHAIYIALKDLAEVFPAAEIIKILPGTFR